MTVPPVANTLTNYGILSGQLFLYSAGRAAFESAVELDKSSCTENCPKKCILLGGLSDGLLPVPYTQQLETVCAENSWSLVQPILSSSYTGFGHGSLQRDCDELQELMNFLIEHRNASDFCLVGHSTGSQDVVYFLENASPELCERVRVVGLQAPVSDREDAASREGFSENLHHATDLVESGKGNEMMPRKAFWAPITAQRYVDLNARGGTDDYFSSDYSDDELKSRLQHLGSYCDLKVLVSQGGANEYIPSHVDIPLLTSRLVTAMNSKCDPAKPVAQKLYLPTGNHNLSSDQKAAKDFVDTLAALLKSSSPSL